MSDPATAPIGSMTAAPLDLAWVREIDAAARVLLGPHDRTGRALADEVARLSELYTRNRGALRTASAALAARLRFFLPRDLPKIEGPLSELAYAGALPAHRPWRVLDLGAGLGTSSLGVATFAARCGIDEIEVMAIERDPRARDVHAHLAARSGKGLLEGVSARIALTAREADLEAGVGPLATFDLVVMGLALNELWVEHEDRLERRAAFLHALTRHLSEDGALIVLEPALRASSRELQAVRDRIASAGSAPFVLAPCTHDLPCPMLSNERDWCHEDLPLSLPEPIAGIARAAGLRWEGLSYSYLVLRNRPGQLVADAHRIVGGPIVTKGQTEWHACGEGRLVRISRLDRTRLGTRGADPMEGAGRGSLIRVRASADDPARQSTRLRTDRAPIERLR